jgi:hypothetical protein
MKYYYYYVHCQNLIPDMKREIQKLEQAKCKSILGLRKVKVYNINK